MLLVAIGGSGAEELRVDSVMYHDPELPVAKRVNTFSPDLKPLWLKALQRPEAELQRLAADTIALAHERGMPDLADTAGALVQTLEAPGQDLIVRRAAARALVALEARDKADVLARHAVEDGLDVAQVVEPALGRWDYKPIRSQWLQRLEDPTTPRALLLLAVEGLGRSKEPEASAPLTALVKSTRTPLSLRLAAARALASSAVSGLVPDARRLAADKSAGMFASRLLAATLLQSHTDPEAIDLLRELAADPQAPVAALGLKRLLAIDPKLAFDLAPDAIGNSDPNVRRLGAQALVEKRDIPATGLLGPLLDDPNPAVRNYVAKSFTELATTKELNAAVIEEAGKMLATDRWRGIEQAALVVAYLDYEPASQRLVELLEHDRPEVYITAAWALGRLGVAETLPAMLDRASRQYSRLNTGDLRGEEFFDVCGQISQLFQAFGGMAYAEADGLMRKFVPKNFGLGLDTRAAACWALGLLHRDAAPDDLTGELVARLSDVQSEPPESSEVRRMCAISLGRMGAQSAIAPLTRFAERDRSNEVGQACGWAIERLTGKPAEPPAEWKVNIRGWFLEPLQ